MRGLLEAAGALGTATRGHGISIVVGSRGRFGLVNRELCEIAFEIRIVLKRSDAHDVVLFIIFESRLLPRAHDSLELLLTAKMRRVLRHVILPSTGHIVILHLLLIILLHYVTFTKAATTPVG